MNAPLRISLSSTILWLVFILNAKVGLFHRHLSFISYKQTIRSCAKPFGKCFSPRGESLKPFGKQLSPSAEMPNPLGNAFRHVAKASNHSGNDFRQARKCQTLRETTFAKRGNAKPLGKRLSPCAEMSNHSGNDFRHARKCQTIREMAPLFSDFKHHHLDFSIAISSSKMIT